MTKISVRIEGRYEVKEDSFSRTYEWQPGCVVLECDCGQELTLPGTSTAPTCRCGADHSAIVQNLQDREGRLRHVVTHPWQYSTRIPPWRLVSLSATDSKSGEGNLVWVRIPPPAQSKSPANEGFREGTF